MSKAIALRLSALLIAAFWANAETVTVRSGNGPLGGTDGAVTFLLGPSVGPFNHTFASGDFAIAQTGPAAFIVSPNPLWISGLPSDPSAQWIGTDPSAGVSYGNTALYAIPFQITSGFSSATLTINYAVDDAIGDSVIDSGPNTGVYLNGSPACGGAFAIGFSQQNSASCGNVGSLLHVGTNWLYIEDGNNAAAGVAQNPAGLLFSATITTVTTPAPGAPSINSDGVVNVASAEAGAVAPGSIAAVFGSFPISSPSMASSVPWPTSLSGLSMQFSGGVQVPLVYASAGQVNIQIPWELAGQTQTQLTATTMGGQTSTPQSVTLASYAPGIFSTNGQGTAQGAILDASYRLVDSSNPATPSAVIQIYCTGLGPVTNRPASGAAAGSDPLSMTKTTPVVLVGGVSAKVLFSGLAPGFVGVYQVNVQMPDGTPTGDSVTVVISIDGVSSNTVTMAVQSAISSIPPAPTGLSPGSTAPPGATVSTLTPTLSWNASPGATGYVVAMLNAATGAAILSQNISTTSIFCPTLVNGATYVWSVEAYSSSGRNTEFTPMYFTVAVPGQTGLTGTWQGTWGSIPDPLALGGLSASLTQNGTAVSGTVTLTNSSCVPGGDVSGTISGNTLSLGLYVGPPQPQVIFLGTVDASGNSILGTYAVHLGDCAGDYGVITLNRTN
jgi:uncharacterized protein (TIGR03437 family)